MDQYSREFIAEKARLRPEDLGLVRTARRSHGQKTLISLSSLPDQRVYFSGRRPRFASNHRLSLKAAA